MMEQGVEYASALCETARAEAEVREQLRMSHLIRRRFEECCRQRAVARAEGDTRPAELIGRSIETANALYLELTGGEFPLTDPAEDDASDEE